MKTPSPTTSTEAKSAGLPEPDLLPHQIEIWKKTIDVQTHFNDLELRIRNYAITILAALLTGSALTLKDNVQVALLGFNVPVAALLLVAALVAWLAFYSMDAFWYHRLLLGAVVHGEQVESALSKVLPEIALTTTIGSPNNNGVGLSKGGSKARMNGFYLTIAAILLFLVVGLLCGKMSRIMPNPGQGSETDQKINDNAAGIEKTNTSEHNTINATKDR